MALTIAAELRAHVAGTRWTHDSALLLAADGDPADVIVRKARAVVFEATEAGWSGPPFDPIELAGLLRIDIVPSQDVTDAAIALSSKGSLQIAYNPDQPRGRQRYSIAHELAHALFPDVAAQTRFRTSSQQLPGDDWQLELLCNLGAAELLMPLGSMGDVLEADLDIDRLLELRREFDVSVEAVALRLTRLSRQPMAIFAAARAKPETTTYRVDYTVPSPAWSSPPRPRVIAAGSAIAECTAVGYTAKGDIDWGGHPSRVEAVGIPPYPGHRFPRVVGIITPLDEPAANVPVIGYLRGDATEPRGTGPRIVGQVVNDKTPNWGGGFARVVRREWPQVQESFRRWAANRDHFRLGQLHVAEADDELWVASLVAMRGYGPAPSPRIRYAALEEGLSKLAAEAEARNASVHLPRIGAGEARGSWAVIAGMVEEILCARGVPVTVYDLPGAPAPTSDRPREPLSVGLDQPPLGI